MLLKKLRITKSDGTLIREVSFKTSLNIILGKSESTGSTNNIGKTTLLRVINFCLGGTLKKFYEDSEKGMSDNTIVLDFLKTYQPIFELELTNNRETLKVKRKIINNNSKLKEINYINDELKNKKEFIRILSKKLFNLSGNKPTFRQLIPKFIRMDTTHTENIIRYLHQSTNDATYEKIHLFMFGLRRTDIFQKKHDKEKELKAVNQKLHALTEELTDNAITQIIQIKTKELAPLLEARERFQINKKYEIEEKQLNELQLKLNDVEKRINDLNLSHSLQLERIEKLRKDEFNVDTSTLNLLYKEAGFYIKDMQKTFEDTINFHNAMLKQDIEYIEYRLRETEKELQQLKKERIILAEHYSKILQKLGQSGSLAEYTKLNNLIEEKIKEISEKEALLDLITNLRYEEQKIKEELEDVNRELELEFKYLDNNITNFSMIFSSLTKKLYNEVYILTYEKNKNNNYVFKIKNEQGNQGSGKKLGLIAAFDLAYFVFCQKYNIPCPRFILHDKLELMDLRQIQIIFDFAIENNIQYIVPIIEDKLSDLKEAYSDHITLRLSESNKFFKI